MENYDAYKDLANAIVKQAVLDYRHCAEVVKDKTSPSSDRADVHIKKIERFFRSDYFNSINTTKYTGKDIIRFLRQATT